MALDHEQDLHEGAGARQLLAFWHALEVTEASNLANLDAQLAKRSESVLSDGFTQEMLSDAHASTYRLYLGCYAIQSAYDLLPGAADRSSRQIPTANGMHALCSVDLDASGKYRAGSFELSNAAWAIGRLLQGETSLQGVERDREVCADLAGAFLTSFERELVASLRDLVDAIRQRLGLRDLSDLDAYRVLIVPCEQSQSPGPGLNASTAFGLDVVRQHAAREELTPVLRAYLGSEQPVVRLNVEAPDAEGVVAEAMHPSGGAAVVWPGTEWPSRSEQVNFYLIRRWLQEDGGIQAVNLPEGGESYPLVREVLVHNLVAKADALAVLPRPQFAFTNRTTQDSPRREGDPWLLIEELHGHGVVMASGVSAAVCRMASKLTLEAPALDADEVVAGLQESLSRPWTLANQDTEQVREALKRLVGLLRTASEAPLESAERNKLWQDATTRYLEAKHRVEQLLTATSELSVLARQRSECLRHLATLARGIAQSLARREESEQQLAALQSELGALENPGNGKERARLSPAVGLIGAVLSLRSGRPVSVPDKEGDHQDARRTLHQRKQVLQAAMAEEQQRIAECAEQQLIVEIELIELERQAVPLCESISAVHLIDWYQGRGLQHQLTELSRPWVIPGLQEAQEHLVSEGSRLVALFMRLESRRMLANLVRGREVVAGGDPGRLSREQLESLVASLLMFTPVVLCTPEELCAKWKLMLPESVGWLVLSDAGHIPARAAAGPMLLAKRVISIGDSAAQGVRSRLPYALVTRLAKQTGLNERWRSLQPSAQDLCEKASVYGCVRETETGTRWAGLPVRVFPHGAEPMLSILERLSSGCRLAVRRPGGLAAACGSGWVDVRGVARGHWLPTEGKALVALLLSLRKRGVRPEQVRVVSPLPRVIEELQVMLAQTPYSVSAIEALRGHPTEVVVVVLGGGNAPARDWVCADPSLLITATANAKSGLYLIGDRKRWAEYPAMAPFVELLETVEMELPGARVVGRRGQSGIALHAGGRPTTHQHQHQPPVGFAQSQTIFPS